MPHTPVNTFDVTAPGFVADPYPIYQRLRSDLPVCWDDKLATWVVSRHADADALLRGHGWSSARLESLLGRIPAAEQAAAAPLREILTNRLVFTDRPVHSRLRSLMQLAFTPRRVELMRPVIQAALDELLAGVRPAGRMELIADVADPLPSLAISAMLGLPPQDRLRFKGWTDDIYGFLGLSAVPLAERTRQATASAGQLRAYLADLFAARRRQPRDDLLSALLAAEEQGDRLSETELFSNVVGLVNASHETTTNLIGNTILALLRNPDQWQKLRAEPRLVANAVEEGLRYESPVQMLGREAAEDVAVGGITVSKGEHVMVLIGAANRDPAVFPDPDRFDVTRTDIDHLAFAAGPHFCLGAALGRLVGQLAVGTLARELPNLRLAEDKVAWRPYPVFRGLRSLALMF